MATSLARQLKRLSTAQTSLLVEDKTKPSLLFDPKDASGLSRDAVFAIGKSGLEELKEINHCFEEFEESLFSEESKTVERAVLDAKANKDLDAQISKFLTIASPYFPLRPTQKALEWLVHRYHVHQFNEKDWLACILPYHDTNIFVRALQLVKISETTHQWHWLFPLQNGGVPLPKNALYNHAAKDHAFLNFICQLVTKSLKVHSASKAPLHPVIAFYTTAVIGALEHADRIREGHLTTLLPSLLKGLRSDVVDYLAGTYMIIAQLARKTTLSRAILNEILAMTAKNSTLAMESVTLLLVLYETQQTSLFMVSNAFLDVLLKMDAFLPSLATLATAYHVGPLVGPLMNTLVPRLHEPQCANLVAKLLNLRFALNDAQTVIQHFIKGLFQAFGKPQVAPELESQAKTVLEQLERQYPDVFENALHSALAELSKKENYKTVADKVKNLLGFHAFALDQDNLETFLRLNHYRKDTRLEAVKLLVEHVKKHEGTVGGSWQSALADRLEDGEPDIVMSVLELGERLLTNLPPQRRVACLLKALNQTGPWKDWLNARRAVLKLLGDRKAEQLFSVEERAQIMVNVLPYLITIEPDDVGLLSVITLSWMVFKSPLLQRLEGGLVRFGALQIAEKEGFALPLVTAKEPELEYVVQYVLEILEKQTMTLAPYAVLFVAPLINELRDPLPTFARLVSALQNLSSLASESCDYSLVVDQLLFNRRPESIAQSARQGQIASEALLHASLQTWQFTRPAGDVMPAFMDLEAPEPLAQAWRIVVQLVDLWSGQQQIVYQKSLELFMDSLESLEAKLAVLSWQWCGHLMDAEIVGPALQKRVIQLSMNLVHAEEEMSWTLEDSPVLVHAIAALTATDPDLREKALELLGAFKRATGSVIFKALNTFRQEIDMDVGQVPVAMAAVLPTFPELRERLCGHLADSAVPPYVRRGLAQALTNIDSQEILKQMLSVISTLLSEGESKSPLSATKSAVLCAVLERFTPTTAPLVATPTGWSVFESALRCSRLCLSVDGTLICPQGVIVELVTKEFFAALPTETQKKLLRCLLDILVEAGVTPVAQRVRKALKRISMDAQLLIPELSGQPVGLTAPATVSGSVIRGRRVQKAQAAKEVVPGESTAWKRTLLLLELLQNKKKVKNIHLLVPTLFDLLKKCLEVEEQAGVEYSKQVILSVLLSVCEKVSETPPMAPVSTNPLASLQLKVGSLVQCVRVSNNPQTHHHALLLLSLAAKLFPDFVLHNMMTIFTFMGTSILRLDDAYSFQVLAKTLETIVPALLTAGNAQPQKAESVATAVTQVFVDALPDVPEHRRLPVMEKLLETLDPERSLWLVPVLLCATVATRGSRWEKSKPIRGTSASNPDEASTKQSPEIEFARHLSHEYSPLVQLQACVRILQYLQTLPQDKDDAKKSTGRKSQQSLEAVPFHAEVHTSRQFCHFKFLVVTYLVNLLSAEKLVGQVVDLGDGERPALEALYTQLVEESLRLAQTVARGGERSSSLLLRAPPSAGASSAILTPAAAARFWKTLLQKCYDIVDRINSLLPSNLFLTVIQRLMTQPSLSIRRRALELLSSKLHHQPEFFEVERKPEAANSLLAVVPTLVRAAQLQDVGTQSVDATETTVYQQAALYALKLVCRLTGKTHPVAFVPVLEAVTALLKTKLAPPLLASTLLALAELVEGVGPRSIPTLHQWMEPLLAALAQPIVADTHELVLLSAVTALQRTVDTIPHFLSPYLARILQHACRLSASSSTVEKQSPLQQRLQAVRHAMAESVAARVLVPAVAQVYDILVFPDDDTVPRATPALDALMKVLSDALTTMSREDLAAQQPTLLNFFLKALDARRLVLKRSEDQEKETKAPAKKKRNKETSMEVDEQELPLEEAGLLETPVVNALVTMVLKLSEASFRPLFFHLYDWATRLPEHKQRLITFYHLTSEIADKLKGLFVLFAGHFIKNTAELLAKLNQPVRQEDDEQDKERSVNLVFPDQESSTLLLDYVLACLYRVCLYDNENFINKERFEALMEPLVNQLENVLGGGEKTKQRLGELVVPVVAQMAVAANDDTLWKALHYQILLKARHTAPQVRLAALATLSKLVAKLGEEYLPLLPEAIPFLAELLEDDENEVELVAQSTIQEMEGVLGEPLQKYF